MGQVLEELKEEILESLKSDSKNIERTWVNRVKQVAQVLKIKIKSKEYDWNKIVDQATVHEVDSLENINDFTAQTKASTGSSSRDSMKESTSTLPSKISLIDKEKIISLYKQMDETKMWKLSTGKLVELQMLKMVESCNFEHPAHSFILDTEDENWMEYFTYDEMKEIKICDVPPMGNIPTELSSILEGVDNSMNIDDLHRRISATYYNPRNQHACHWLQRSLLEALELHMSGFLRENDQSERDFISRLWRAILTAFDFSRMTIREERPCKATDSMINKKRRLSTLDSIERKRRSKTPDHLIKFGAYEIGLTEAAKTEDKNGNKYFVDTMIKAPKMLKDMLVKLIESSSHKKHSLRTVGFITSGAEIKLIVMDMPGSYICRLLHTDSYKYPLEYLLFSKDMTHCLQLIWTAKMILEDTIHDITSVEPSQKIEFASMSEISIYPTFYNTSKK
ncbi:hypothetical protein G6F46_011207 [Rhizopus delemar]|uniref:Uncharacterized protein n=2 Tax=Rhizopus TaxID=4842 RepID=A0A9P6YTP6_9FUNG|nr:hypothetical protein G6F36_011287 [Rhizopus arrhizus]KAG1448517.1 hypothetical protein G6F55_010612 [Rhizopus delemar]KAG1490217.1 hypothetical protein G6F54_010882 [Rhizopus delemar]KAG1501744.1 hypothetical protein G6F53_011014 [Rhizopus delemar]KAG1526825.1 hypothetical protein G6F52_002087 [Rhizopus delemar]